VADNYQQFSEILANLSEHEEAWLKEQLQPIRIFANKEIPNDSVPAELADAEPDWTGIRFLHDKDDYDSQWTALGFEHDFATDSDEGGWGRHLWLHADDWGNPENAAYLVQKFLKMFRPDQCWSLTYAATCSKPRVGEFGGGAVFVTADEIKYQNSYEFVEQERTAFEAKKNVVLQEEKLP
jgi:hypothetical protein